MSLFRLKLPLLVSALAFTGATHATTTLISEGFDHDSGALAGQGWVIDNQSTPGGSTTWFEPGDGALLPAYSGSSYMAANYLSAGDGGTVDNWLISPTFSTASGGYVTLYLIGANEVIGDYVSSDTLKFGFSNGSATTSDFGMGSTVTAPAGWTAYTFTYAAGGAGAVGRFAIEYTGDSAVVDYVGIDSLSINAVPEPATWAMFALGAAALVARRRRSAR
jgi:hypothetical protein